MIAIVEIGMNMDDLPVLTDDITCSVGKAGWQAVARERDVIGLDDGGARYADGELACAFLH